MKNFVSLFLTLILSFVLSFGAFNTAYAADVVNYLIVGGGGGGGGGNTQCYNAGGGGGAGGVLIGTATVSAQSYQITVGLGGAGGSGGYGQSGTTGSNGGDSSAFTITATGGGAGGGDTIGKVGQDGGSGGGSGGSACSSGSATGGGNGIPGQGNNGGAGYSLGGEGGGGGGASAPGQDAQPQSGHGGDGVQNSITGTLTYYGGGGGAGYNGAGGQGGGGNAGTNGTDGLGGGGGGGGGPAGTGGSGIVVISYPTDSLTATGGTITTDGAGNTLHTFTSNGTFTVTSTSTVIHATGVSLNEATHSLYPNGTDQLTASVSPSNATDQSVAFSSNNPSVATVNSTGLITAVAVGSAIVTVTTTDGGFTATDTISVIPVSTTVNRVAKFVLTSPQTVGDSLLSDDGSNVTLTSGNFFLQAGSFIDSIASGILSFGITNASSLLFGHTGSNSIFNGNLGIGTSTPGTVFSIGGIANFSDATTTFYGSGINLSGGCFAVNGVCAGSNVIDTAHGGTASTTPLGGILVGNGTNPIKSLLIGTGLAFDGSTLTLATHSNCASATSPASCGSAPSGSVALATGGSTLVVNTTAVTANSQIFVIQDSSLGSRLGVTCNTVTNRVYSVSARIAGTSFTIKSSANPTGSPACLSYWILN